MLVAKLPPKAVILNAGAGLCGSALHTVGFTTIDGIDVSQRSLAIAKTTEAYRCLTAMDTQRPPLSVPDDHYDGLICLGVLTYLPETTNTLTEFSSVVKSGGFIAMTQQSKI